MNSGNEKDEQSPELDQFHLLNTDDLPMVNIWNQKSLDPELRQIDEHRHNINSDELCIAEVRSPKTLDPELQEMDENRQSTNSEPTRHLKHVQRVQISGNSSKSVTLAQKAVKMKHYTVPIKCWPRVYKSQQLIKGLVKRCSYIEGLLNLPTQPRDTFDDITEIDIFIHSSVNESPKSLLVRDCNFEEKEERTLDLLEEHLERTQGSLMRLFSGVFVDTTGIQMVKSISGKHMTVVKAENLTEKKPETRKIQISSLLERVVFEGLAIKCNILNELRQNKIPEYYTEGYVGTYTVDNARKYKDNIRQLLGEMVALFKRSTLPANERPVVKGYEKTLVSKEEVVEGLFKLDDKIRGCGYQYSTFVVNIEDSSDAKDVMERIEDFLREHAIEDVKFNFVTKSVSEYRQVGAEVSLREDGHNSGTLGAFASFIEASQESTCALISKHLSKDTSGRKLYIKDEDGNMREFGDVVEATTQGDSYKYDIAAAKLYTDYMGQCDVQFKNLENEPRPGKLYTGNNDIDLQDLPVHFWGAMTKPGRGIISIPELILSDAPGTYIHIQDREPEGDEPLQRMAVKGDSGAIVCADDLDDEKVHVISMFMGSLNDTETSQNTPAKKTYITLNVQKGVEHLQNIANGTFKLKGMSDEQ